MVKIFFFFSIISTLHFSVPHDPSEIILICWFGAQETFLIINVENILYCHFLIANSGLKKCLYT